jgi:hypothetical protein
MQRPSGRNDYSRDSNKKQSNQQINDVDQESYKEISTVRTSHENKTAELAKN